MPAPSLIYAARHAPDRRERILKMAKVMRHHRNGPEGACTFVHLCQAGFTEAEIVAYRDDARACISGKPSALRSTPPDRLKGILLVRKARAIHKRLDGAAKGEARA